MLQEAQAREALAEAADAGADPGEDDAEAESEPENEMEAERAANISRNNRALADFGLAPDALPRPLAPNRGARHMLCGEGFQGWPTLGLRPARCHARWRRPWCGPSLRCACCVGLGFRDVIG